MLRPIPLKLHVRNATQTNGEQPMVCILALSSLSVLVLDSRMRSLRTVRAAVPHADGYG